VRHRIGDSTIVQRRGCRWIADEFKCSAHPFLKREALIKELTRQVRPDRPEGGRQERHPKANRASRPQHPPNGDPDWDDEGDQ
jgi:hypothetical protein